MENWSFIDGYLSYQISDCGNVRSFVHGGEPRLLRPKNRPNGYLEYSLYQDKKQTYHLAHRLVAKTFLTPAPRRPWVNHKDGNKANNKVENLEWSTPRQNNAHANARGVRHALTNPKRAHKLTAEIVAEIRATVPRGKGAKAAAARFGISTTLLQRILANRMWRMP